MQALTAMTLGALALGAAGFVYDRSVGQTHAACPVREASVYFERGEPHMNAFSTAVIERVVAEARACGAREIFAETSVAGDYAEAISNAFRARGLKVIVTPSSEPAATDVIAGRAANLRLTMSRGVG